MPELHEVSPNKGRSSGPGGSNPADIGGHNPGNDPGASVEFAAAGPDEGAPLGAAAGVETGGTANMPAPVTEMDWGPAGTGMGVSGTGGMHDLGSGTDHPLPRPHEGGPTHPAAGYDTTRTTGGLIQHPKPSNLTLANTTGGTGDPSGNAQGLEHPGQGESQGMVGAGQGNAMMGGGQDQSPLVDLGSSDESRDQSQASAT